MTAKQSRSTSTLRGLTVYLAGRLWRWTPQLFADFVTEEGGRFTKTLDANVDLVVVGDCGRFAAGEKKAKALQAKGAGFRVVSISEFCQLALPPLETWTAWLHGGVTGVKRWNRIATLGAFDDQLPAVSDQDLKGADLREIYLDGAEYRNFNLTGADLRGAVLSLIDSRLDRARLENAHIRRLERCSCVHVDCSGLGHTVEPSLLSCDFSHADFHGIRLYSWQAPQCRFDHANLNGLLAHEVDFTKASFVKADLTDAILSESRLQEADFRGANLRRANLANAELRGANFAGADVTEANFCGAKLDRAALSRARGSPRLQPTGAVGTACKRLFQIGKGGNVYLATTAIIQCHDRSIELKVEVPPYYRIRDSHGGFWDDFGFRGAEAVLKSLANKWSGATLDVPSVAVKAYRCKQKKGELLDLATRFWSELLGVVALSTEEVKEATRSRQATLPSDWQEWLAKFRGNAGVQAWNGHAVRLTKRFADAAAGSDLAGVQLVNWQASAMDFRGAKFAGANLEGANLKSCKGSQADLSKARLEGAELARGDWSEANFERANLRKASFMWTSLRGANLRKANLSDVDFYGADLRSADLTDADLTDAHLGNAKYDKATRFSSGFQPPRGMVFKESRKPASARRKLSKARHKLTVDEFLKRLGRTTDAAKLDKALAMLKADRFKLYAQVGSDQLVGVVKSQGDPDLVYSCKLASDGAYGCCTQNLNICGGLRGSICKHLLVLIVGLSKSGDLDPNTIDNWVLSSKKQKPVVDKDAMGETFLRYKGAEAGEVDWRPTETIPEDFYAL